MHRVGSTTHISTVLCLSTVSRWGPHRYPVTHGPFGSSATCCPSLYHHALNSLCPHASSPLVSPTGVCPDAHQFTVLERWPIALGVGHHTIKFSFQSYRAKATIRSSVWFHSNEQIQIKYRWKVCTASSIGLRPHCIPLRENKSSTFCDIHHFVAHHTLPLVPANPTSKFGVVFDIACPSSSIPMSHTIFISMFQSSVD